MINISMLYMEGTVVKAIENEESEIPVGAIGTIEMVDETDLDFPYFVDFKEHGKAWMLHSEVIPTSVKTEFYGKSVNFIGGNGWIHLYEFAEGEAKGYSFSHEPRWNDKGIGVLPFRKNSSTGLTEYLGVMEKRFVHGNSHKLYALTGGYDNDTITTLQTAVKELKEETGYIAQESDIIPLGEIFITKMSTAKMELFAVDVTNLPQGEKTTDGSLIEETAYPVWVDSVQLAKQGDNLMSKLVMLLNAHSYTLPEQVLASALYNKGLPLEKVAETLNGGNA